MVRLLLFHRLFNIPVLVLMIPALDCITVAHTFGQSFGLHHVHLLQYIHSDPKTARDYISAISKLLHVRLLLLLSI